MPSSGWHWINEVNPVERYKSWQQHTGIIHIGIMPLKYVANNKWASPSALSVPDSKPIQHTGNRGMELRERDDVSRKPISVYPIVRSTALMFNLWIFLTLHNTLHRWQSDPQYSHCRCKAAAEPIFAYFIHWLALSLSTRDQMT